MKMENQRSIHDRYSDIERCINCGIAISKGNPPLVTFSKKKHSILSLPAKFRKFVAHWIQREIPDDSGVCAQCFKEFENLPECDDIPPRVLGHTTVCIGCGLSQKQSNRSFRKVDEKSLQYWPKHTYYQVHLICYKCHIRLLRTLKKVNFTLNGSIKKLKNEPVKLTHLDDSEHNTIAARFTSNMEIILPCSQRSSNSNSHCFLKNCNDQSRYRTPKHIQLLLATNLNYHVSAENRICKDHLVASSLKYEDISNFNDIHEFEGSNSFRISQFESFLDNMKTGMIVANFECVEAMPNHVCEYWTGLKVYQFMQLYKNLNMPNISKTAFAAYLIMKRTGDSIEQLAKVFNIPLITLQKELRNIGKINV